MHTIEKQLRPASPTRDAIPLSALRGSQKRKPSDSNVNVPLGIDMRRTAIDHIDILPSGVPLRSRAVLQKGQYFLWFYFTNNSYKLVYTGALSAIA